MLKENASCDLYNLAINFDEALGLKLNEIKEEEIPAEILEKAENRWQAKLNRDWEVADTLRAELLNLGYEILDSKTEYKVVKK